MQSYHIQKWKNEAVLESVKENVLRLLTVRWQQPIPKEIHDAVGAQTDAATLSQWLYLIVQVNSLKEWQSAILS